MNKKYTKKDLQWRCDNEGIDYTLTQGIDLNRIEDDEIREAAIEAYDAIEKFLELIDYDEYLNSY